MKLTQRERILLKYVLPKKKLRVKKRQKSIGEALGDSKPLHSPVSLKHQKFESMNHLIHLEEKLDEIFEFKEKEREYHVPGVARKTAVGAGALAGATAGLTGGHLGGAMAGFYGKPRVVIDALSPRAKKDIVDEGKVVFKKGEKLRGYGINRLHKLLLIGGTSLGAYGGYKGARALLEKRNLTPKEKAKKKALEQKIKNYK